MGAEERLPPMSGYIAGKAFRNGYIVSLPGSRVPRFVLLGYLKYLGGSAIFAWMATIEP